MKAAKTIIVPIGNSKGVRIPKTLLEASGIGLNVELKLDKGKIIISPIRSKKEKLIANEEALLSEKALSDWLRPEEDKAWKDLQ